MPRRAGSCQQLRDHAGLHVYNKIKKTTSLYLGLVYPGPTGKVACESRPRRTADHHGREASSPAKAINHFTLFLAFKPPTFNWNLNAIYNHRTIAGPTQQTNSTFNSSAIIHKDQPSPHLSQGPVLSQHLQVGRLDHRIIFHLVEGLQTRNNYPLLR